MLADTTAPTDRQADDLAKLARTIRKCHATIGRAYDHMRIHSDTALNSAMAAGDALHAAKKKLGHGKWLPWLEKHCGLSECEAQRYMRLAKNREKIEAEIEANPARVTDLSLRGALRLISPPKVIEAAAEPTPTEAVEEPIESSILTGPATHWLEDERGVNKRVSREVFEAAGSPTGKPISPRARPRTPSWHKSWQQPRHTSRSLKRSLGRLAPRQLRAVRVRHARTRSIRSHGGASTASTSGAPSLKASSSKVCSKPSLPTGNARSCCAP